MNTNNELERLKGTLIAHGFVIRRLLMLVPQELGQYVLDELARLEQHPVYSEMHSEVTRHAIRSELESLLAPEQRQESRLVQKD